MNRVVTDKWYGFYTFKNKERARSFHILVEDNFAEHVYPHVHKIIFPTENADLTDVMYELLANNPTWYAKNVIHHRLWILSIARFIYKVHGGLTFSTLDKKYFYLNKITVITQEVDQIITSNIAKEFLGKVCGCALLGVCVYKYMVPLMINITNLLTHLV
jgi:hypothetical protein